MWSDYHVSSVLGYFSVWASYPAKCFAAVLKVRVTNESHFHYPSFVIQVVNNKNWQTNSWISFPLSAYAIIKQFYMGSSTGKKKGNMEILNWKFNEQSSRHGQLRATILRKCISHHVFHLLLWHVCWCQKRLVSAHMNGRTWPIFKKVPGNLRQLCHRTHGCFIHGVPSHHHLCQFIISPKSIWNNLH